MFCPEKKYLLFTKIYLSGTLTQELGIMAYGIAGRFRGY